MLGVCVGAWTSLTCQSAERGVYGLPFEWQDTSGKAVKLEKWRGRPLIIGMAYTACKMYCPLTIRQLKKVQAQLGPGSPGKPAPEIIFVTLDPRMDTSERLARFEKSWHLENWHFLVGSDLATHVLARRLGIRYQEIDEHIIHDNKIILVDGAGEITRTIEGWDSISSEIF